MRWPWQNREEDAAEDDGPTHEEMQAVYEEWDGAAATSERADRRRAEQRAAKGRAGRRSPFWDKKREITVGDRPRHNKTETFTARSILRRVLTAPDGYVVGFSNFEVKNVGGFRTCVGNDELGKAFHVRFGRRLVAKDAAAAYWSVFMDGQTAGVVAYAGPKSGIDASKIVKGVAKAGGGRPDKGGNESFAQASGLDGSKMDKLKRATLEVLVD